MVACRACAAGAAIGLALAWATGWLLLRYASDDVLAAVVGTDD